MLNIINWIVSWLYETDEFFFPSQEMGLKEKEWQLWIFYADGPYIFLASIYHAVA